MRGRNSDHWKYERMERERLIQQIGEGEDYDEFVVDRGHRNGAELHVLTTNGIIKIYNLISHKLVTKLIARPGQIKKYYPYGDYPEDIIQIAIQHKRMAFNEI